MGNVWDAMKKHAAESTEQAETPEQAAASGSAPSAAPGKPHRKASGLAEAERAVARASSNGRYSELLVAHHDRGAAITEEYRALRTSLLAQAVNERFCYAVTSCDASEGKTVTCMNLALVMAERVDRRTIVIDFDLRKGRMADLFKAPSEPGMAEVLRGTATLDQCVQATCYPNLFFLPAGRIKQVEVGELVGGPELEEIVGKLKRQYDYVIFDTPPINWVSDAGVLGRAGGEALLVVRMYRTHRESVDKAIRLLHAANVKLAGIILTHRKYHIPDYLYRYS